MNSFFRELKQRRVYRIAIGYAVAAWLIIQVASTVLPTFQVPLWVLQTLIVAVALGFPAAVVLSWVFDLTSSGIEITPDGSGPVARRSARNLSILASASLLIAAMVIGGFWLWHPWRNVDPNASGVSEKSIAVLPLENLSDDKENAFFADGIQDDLLASLAKIKELKVISRSSVMGYRDVSKRNLREIGLQLGVATILEGSVRRVPNRVLISVALIATRTAQQIWSERFDRTLADSLTVQGELATEIANALRAKLSPEEKARVETKPTENADAYVLYLRARDYQTRPTGLLQDYQMAENLYAQAIELDPNFALAHARLSATLAYTYLNFHPTAEVSRRAREEADRALELQPDLGESHLARALCLYWTEKNYEAALQEMEKVASLSPGSGEADFFSGAIRRRQGRWRDALNSMNNAFGRDPRNNQIAREILLTECLIRDWPGAARAGTRAISLAPDLPMLRVEKNYVDIWAKGDLTPLRRDLAAVAAGVDPDGEVTYSRWDAASLARDFTAADQAVAACSTETVITPFGAVLSKNYLLGCNALARGDAERARKLLEAARPGMETEAANFPLDPFRQAHLGLLDAFLDRKEDAVRLGRRAVELLPETKDAYFGPCLSGMLALIYARCGEKDEAFALIDRLLTTPGALSQVFEGSITLADLRMRWQWDPLREDARFKKIVAGPEPKTIVR